MDSADGALSPRDRVVLSVLVLRGHEVVTADRIADALWGDEPPASASKVVQGCISRLRKALGQSAIETHGTGYRLALGADDVDLHRFERLLGRAREQLALRAPDRALRTAEEALALWRGRPFDDVEGWDAARFEAARLEELRHEAEELRVDAALRAGRHAEVLATARGLVDAAPTRERRWELLALAQYRAGSQADALRTIHEARRRLADELGLDPGPGIVELEAAILRHDADLSGPTIPAVVDDTCPWPGLLAYSVEDAEGFAGREREIEAGLARLADVGVLVVVGPSGSGKSSLVRAGIVGRLELGGRSATVLTPGARPADSLDRIAAADLLVVDQCEEVVTACEDPQQRERFFDALVEHAERRTLVVALRADRVGDLSGHAGFARLVERGLFLLGPMDEAALRAAIERPARAAGLLLEPGLVDLVVRDVLDEPGALPLMSHALQQTWARREGRTLTVAGYNESGGIRTAVAQSAEAVYEDVGPDDQPKLRDLLLRLVVPLEDGAPARVRLSRRAIAGDPGYQRLVDRLVDVRLLTTDGDVVELAHEALARAWPRFQDWLADDIEGLRLLRHLGVAAGGWDALGRPDSELYRGERLAGVLAWQARTDPELTALERAFVDALVERQRAELQSAEVQVVRERRTVRRLRRLVAGVAVLAGLALVAGAVALGQRDEADDQARIAEARRIAAEALEARPHDRALLLAVEAVRRSDDADTRGALLTTIGRSPRAMRVVRTGSPLFIDLDVSPTGDQVATSDAFGDVRVYDRATGEVVHTFAADGESFGAPTYSPDGESLAVSRFDSACEFSPCGFSDVALEIYDADHLTGEPTRLRGLDGPLVAVAWSSDGRHIAASLPAFLGNNDSMAVWAIGNPEPMNVFEPDDAGVDFRPLPGLASSAWLAFAEGGSTVFGSGAGLVSEIDIDTGRVLRELDGFGGLALSPDRSTIAVRGGTRVLELRDVETGAVRRELVGHDDTIVTAAFSADGALVATGSVDETVMVWDAESGTRLFVLEGHAGPVTDVAFHQRGERLFSVSADRTMIEWDLASTTGLTSALTGPFFQAPSESTVVLSPDGGSIAVMGEHVRLVDVARGRTVQLEGTNDYDVTWGAFSDDGDRFVTVDYFGRVRMWDGHDGELLAESASRQPPVGAPGLQPINLGAVTFLPGRSAVLIAEYDGQVTELDAETLEPTGRSIDLGLSANEHPAGIRAAPGGRFAVTWSPFDDSEGTNILFGDIDDERIDRRVHVASWGIRAAFDQTGARYAFGGFDGRIGVVDVATGEIVGPADPVHTGPVSWLAFSPDGATLASLGFEGFLALGDAATGRPQARIQPGGVNLNGAIGYAPDGRTVVLGYRDGTALAFDTDPAAWVAHACTVAGRDLTEGEWRDAFGDEPHRSTC